MDNILSSNNSTGPLLQHRSDQSLSRKSRRRAEQLRRRRHSRKEPKPTSPKDIAKQAAIVISFLFSCFLIDRFVYLVLQDSIDPFHETNLRGHNAAEQQLMMPQHQKISNSNDGQYDSRENTIPSSLQTNNYDPQIPQQIIPQIMISATDRILDDSNCIDCNDTFPVFFLGSAATNCTELSSEEYVEFCNSDEFWIENRLCQQSCFNQGIPYNGEPACCNTLTPTPLPTLSPTTSAPSLSQSPSSSPSTNPPSLTPSQTPSLSQSPSSSPSTNPPSLAPSQTPTTSHAPSISKRPTPSPTRQAFMPSGDMKYNNTNPQGGPWAECLGWEGQDCRDYIITLVNDQPRIIFLGVRWVPDNGQAVDPVNGTMPLDGEGGTYVLLGSATQHGNLIRGGSKFFNLHRVVVTVNDEGFVVNKPRRG